MLLQRHFEASKFSKLHFYLLLLYKNEKSFPPEEKGYLFSLRRAGVNRMEPVRVELALIPTSVEYLES